MCLFYSNINNTIPILKEITETKTLEQLKDVVIKVNSFVKENKLKTSSEEFQKLEKFIKIMLIQNSLQRINQQIINENLEFS